MKLTNKMLPFLSLALILGAGSAKATDVASKNYNTDYNSCLNSESIASKNESNAWHEVHCKDKTYMENNLKDIKIDFKGDKFAKYNVNRTFFRKWYKWADLKDGTYNLQLTDNKIDMLSKEHRGHLIYRPFEMKVPVKAHSKRTITLQLNNYIEMTNDQSCDPIMRFELFNFKNKNSFDTEKNHPSIFSGPDTEGYHADKEYCIYSTRTDLNHHKKYYDQYINKAFTFSFENDSDEDKVFSNYFAYSITRAYKIDKIQFAFRYVFTNGWNLISDVSSKGGKYTLNNQGDSIQFGEECGRFNVNKTDSRKWYRWRDLECGKYNLNTYVTKDKNINYHIEQPAAEHRGHLYYLPFKLNFKVKANTTRVVNYRFNIDFNTKGNKAILPRCMFTNYQFFAFGEKDCFDVNKVHPEYLYGPNIETNDMVPEDKYSLENFNKYQHYTINFKDETKIYSKAFVNNSNKDKEFTLNFAIAVSREYRNNIENAFKHWGFFNAELK